MASDMPLNCGLAIGVERRGNMFYDASYSIIEVAAATDAKPFMLLTGASRGIGHTTVILFQDRGWRVFTVSRQPFSEDCAWPSARETTSRLIWEICRR